MRRIVVLRPEPGASETVARARSRGLDAVALPLFEIEPVPWDPPDPALFDGLLLTSANAVRQGGGGLKRFLSLPVHAVGETTAKAARDAGFAVATVGGEGVDELLPSLPAGLRLLHLCGEDRRVPAQARQEVEPMPVYRSCALPTPDIGPLKRVVALVHSSRAGQRLCEIVHPAIRASIAVGAISDAAAQAVGGGWETVEAADEPSDDALLALAAWLCNKPSAK